MDERDELIRQIVEGEADAEAHAAARRLAARDPDFGVRLERARAASRALAELPTPPDPGPPLTERIMAAVRAAPAPRRRRGWPALARPVAVPLWGLLAAAAAVVVAVAWGALRGAAAPATLEPAAAVRSGPSASTAGTCPQETRVLVRFVLRAPRAARVAVVGDFNGWARTATPLIEAADEGVWTVQVPLPPGRYQYKFLVDGSRWILDPAAPSRQPDGFGGQNSVIHL